jgi:hypothetical protein
MCMCERARVCSRRHYRTNQIYYFTSNRQRLTRSVGPLHSASRLSALGQSGVKCALGIALLELSLAPELVGLLLFNVSGKLFSGVQCSAHVGKLLQTKGGGEGGGLERDVELVGCKGEVIMRRELVMENNVGIDRIDTCGPVWGRRCNEG